MTESAGEVVSGAQLTGAYPTTAASIEWGKVDWREARGQTASVSIDAVKNPIAVTAPRRIY
jgi:hypothetical protein